MIDFKETPRGGLLYYVEIFIILQLADICQKERSELRFAADACSWLNIVFEVINFYKPISFLKVMMSYEVIIFCKVVKFY